MNVRKRESLVRIVLLAGGIGLGLLAADPASAQIACPYGYAYYSGWGCIAAPYEFGGVLFDPSRGEHHRLHDHENHHRMRHG